jgi:hypothetical protein
MKSTKVAVFDRKSGAAEGPAARPGSRTKVSVPLVLPQNRHPKRSAAQIARMTSAAAFPRHQEGEEDGSGAATAGGVDRLFSPPLCSRCTIAFSNSFW